MHKCIYQNEQILCKWKSWFGAVRKTHIPKLLDVSIYHKYRFGSVQHAYAKAPVVALWGNYEVRSYTNTAYTKNNDTVISYFMVRIYTNTAYTIYQNKNCLYRSILLGSEQCKKKHIYQNRHSWRLSTFSGSELYNAHIPKR